MTTVLLDTQTVLYSENVSSFLAGKLIRSKRELLSRGLQLILLLPPVPQIGKTRFHKSHAFDYRREVPVFVGDNKPGIGKMKTQNKTFSVFYTRVL